MRVYFLCYYCQVHISACQARLSLATNFCHTCNNTDCMRHSKVKTFMVPTWYAYMDCENNLNGVKVRMISKQPCPECLKEEDGNENPIA